MKQTTIFCTDQLLVPDTRRQERVFLLGHGHAGDDGVVAAVDGLEVLRDECLVGELTILQLEPPGNPSPGFHVEVLVQSLLVLRSFLFRPDAGPPKMIQC